MHVTCSGKVPGSVYGDLLDNKMIPDPFNQDNEYFVRDVMNHDFSYSRSFTFPKASLGLKQYLVCEGIDTLSEISINGRLVAKTDNMHRIWRFDIGGYLQDGENNIEILLKSPLRYIREKDAACPYRLFQAKDAVKGYIHLRKGSSMFGWDWGPQLPDAGIWRDIYIESVENSIIRDVLILQNHETSSVVLDIRVQGENFDNRSGIIAECEILSPSGETLYTGTQAMEPALTFRHTIINPLKWYPIGYGSQPLYLLKITYRHRDHSVYEKTLRFGLREVHVKRDDDEFGQSFTFVINGIEVFGKGTDYIPEDNLLGRTNPQLTRKLLEAAIQANHNMIRVWGGGIYPADYLFDICDELGIMVWQDLMFACSVYDMNDLEWIDTMKLEIRDNLNRFRHHPSIVLICGNNENETAVECWDIPNRDLSKVFYLEQYERIIAPIVAECFPQIDYWPSSPSSGKTFIQSNSDNFGDMHYWGVWHNNEPIAYYRKYFPRFMSEFGIQSFPSLATVKTFAKDEDLNIFSYIMEQHQKNNTANDKILSYIGKMFRYPKDFESLLYVSQLIQAEGVRYGVEHWRRNYGRCMGALYWQLNDCWPVASWSGIDYFHRWKVLHYHSKKFYQPVMISIMEEGHEASIHVTNDTLEAVKGRVIWKLMDFKGATIQEGSMEVLIGHQSALKIASLKFEFDTHTAMDSVLYCRLENQGRLISENQVSFVPDKHLKLTPAHIKTDISVRNGQAEIKLSTDAFAKYVEISLGDSDSIFSDNYFFLIPGIEKTITFATDMKEINIKNHLRIRSLRDTY